MNLPQTLGKGLADSCAGYSERSVHNLLQAFLIKNNPGNCHDDTAYRMSNPSNNSGQYIHDSAVDT